MGNIELQWILKFPVYLCFTFAISSADYTVHCIVSMCTPNKISATKEDCIVNVHTTAIVLNNKITDRGSFLPGVLVFVSVCSEEEDCFVSVHTYSTRIYYQSRRFPAWCASLSVCIHRG